MEMTYQFTLYILPLVFTAVIMVRLSLHLWRRRANPGALPLMILLLAVGEWVSAYCLELLGSDAATKLFWAKIEYFGVVIVPLAWLHFAVQFSGPQQTRKHRPWLLAVLSGIPLLTLIMVWTPALRHLIWIERHLEQRGPFVVFQTRWGAGFFVFAAYDYLLLAYGSYLLLKQAIQSHRLYRRRLIAVLVAVFIPWLGNLLYLTGLSPLPGLDLSPFGFAMSGAVLFWAVHNRKLMGLLPIARSTVIENMQSAVIVLDKAGKVVDLNPAAVKLFEDHAETWPEKPLPTLRLIWPELAAACPDDFTGHFQKVIPRTVAGSPRWYDLRGSTLRDSKGRVMGRLLQLLDITARRRTQEKLRQVEDRYRDLVEHSHNLICIHDLDGRILSINAIALESLGYQQDQVLDRTISDFLLPERRSQFERYLETIRTQGRAEGLMRIRTRTGATRIWKYDNSLRTEGVDQPIVRGMARDITDELKAREVTERRLEELSALHAVSLAGLEATDENALIIDATRIIGESRYPDNFGIMLLDQHKQELYFHPSYRGMAAQFQDLRIPVGQGVTGGVVASGEPRRIDDVSTTPEFISTSDALQSVLCVPLKISGEVIGVINAESETTGAFQPEDERLLATFASQLATAIEKLRLQEAERQQAEILSRTNALISALSSVTTKMEATQTPDQVMAVLGAELNTLGFYCLVALSEPESQDLIFHYTSLPPQVAQRIERLGGLKFGKLHFRPEQMTPPGKNVENIHLMTMSDGISILAQVVPGMMHKFIERVLHKFDLFEDTLVFHLPLRAEGGFLGVLWLMGADLQKSDLPAMSIFARQTALALENARLFEETQVALTETQALYQVSRAATTIEHLPALLQDIVDTVADAMSLDRVMLIMVDPGAKEILRIVIGGLGAKNLNTNMEFTELWSGLSGWVLRELKPALSPNGRADSRESQKIQQSRMQTKAGDIIVAPLLYRENVLGTLTAINRPDQRSFGQRDVDLLMAIAQQVAIAIENAQLFVDIQHLAKTDELTGLYNRHYFFEQGEREFERARRYQKPLAAIMFDLDHFKPINDQYGHVIGDEVLRGVAQRCLENTREIDILARYGGDEFSMLLPETSLPGARRIAKRLHQKIASHPVETSAGEFSITISLGVAAIDSNMPDLKTLLNHADAASYRAKEDGRNRVCCQEL